MTGARLAPGTALALLAGLVALPAGAFPAPAPRPVPPALVVTADPGGRVDRRMEEIGQLRRDGRPVEIRGECLSACTLYLALGPQACVSRRAQLGFHGPSFYGVPIGGEWHRRWTAEIAGHYPEPIRAWYLDRAAGLTLRMRVLSGETLIAAGVRECAE